MNWDFDEDLDVDTGVDTSVDTRGNSAVGKEEGGIYVDQDVDVVTAVSHLVIRESWTRITHTEQELREAEGNGELENWTARQ
jgi:hypothetical protein